jgi:hypothetical protein
MEFTSSSSENENESSESVTTKNSKKNRPKIKKPVI